MKPTALLLCVAIPSLVHAGPTGLFLMPIADVLRHREASFAVGTVGYEGNVDRGHDYGHSLTLGLFDRVEVGYDGDFLGGIGGNAKLLLCEDRRGALSVGATSWNGASVDPYLVGRLDGKGYRIHGGLWRTDGTWRPMLGSDFPAGPGLTGAVEYRGGGGAQCWASLNYALPGVPGLGLQVAVGVSPDRAVGTQHAANLAYTLKL